jgi:hypothetical protein
MYKEIGTRLKFKAVMKDGEASTLTFAIKTFEDEKGNKMWKVIVICDAQTIESKDFNDLLSAESEFTLIQGRY